MLPVPVLSSGTTPPGSDRSQSSSLRSGSISAYLVMVSFFDRPALWVLILSLIMMIVSISFCIAALVAHGV